MLNGVKTVKEVAAMLGVSQSAVACWIADGKLGAVDVSATATKRKIYRIPDEELERFIEERRTVKS